MHPNKGWESKNEIAKFCFCHTKAPEHLIFKMTWQKHNLAICIFALPPFTFLAGQPVYPHSIEVSSDGPAAGKHFSCMGTYNKIEGQQQNGRPIWKHSDRDDRILFYAGENIYIQWCNACYVIVCVIR